MSVYEVAIAAHDLLVDANLPHGFGGALALNYYADPRATIDVDLCVFVPWSTGVADIARFEQIGFAPRQSTERSIPVAGIRLFKEGDPVPLDVFFSLDDSYDEIADRLRPMPFGPDRVELPFLSAEDIVLFKLTFNRDKDWVDIRRVVADGPDLDLEYIDRKVVEIRGPGMHPRVARLRAMVKTANRADPEDQDR